jgi:hypothetical protein
MAAGTSRPVRVRGAGIELAVGKSLPTLDKGLVSYKHLARWCAAQQNWDKVHYNQDYARKYSRLPDVYVNGAIKSQFICQFLSEGFGTRGWIWRVDTDFFDVDLAEQRLSVRGEITEVAPMGRYVGVTVGFRIRNAERKADTTRGTAIVLLASNGGTVTGLDRTGLPRDRRVDTAVRPATRKVPAKIAAMVGKRVDRIRSVVPVDLSRLRLMADAVTGVRPWHYHPQKAKRSAFGEVVALPLYPLHGLESWPDARPFDPDPEALGREGVTDVGRLDPRRLGLKPGGIFNGGNFVEIHGLARPGDTIVADSVLAGARFSTEHPAGPAIFVDTLNRYRTTGGRSLITERQVMVYRVMGR